MWHFPLMKFKAYTSKICVLLAILFLINPVLATADVLFSAIHAKFTSSLSTASSEAITCHDEINADPATKQVMDHPDME